MALVGHDPTHVILDDEHLMHHPGPLARERCTVRAAMAADQHRLWIAPGTTLFDGLAADLLARGIDHASFLLFDGDLSEAFFHTANPTADSDRVIAYGPPFKIEGGATLLTANATLGHKADGQPIVHCHGVLMDRDGGLYGGHLPTETCVVGKDGVTGWMVVSKDGGFVQRHDPETLFPLLFPTSLNEVAR